MNQVEDSRPPFMKNALEATIRIGLVVLLALWCFNIVRPFISTILWGVIIAIALLPTFDRFAAWIPLRRGLSAGVFTLILLVLLIGPVWMLTQTMVEATSTLSSELADGQLTIPPPGDRVAGLPVIGERLHDFWALASENIEDAVAQVAPQIRQSGRWLLSAAAGAGFGVLKFVAAIIISGVLMAHAEGGARAAHAVFTRLAGEQGSRYADLAENTIRSVARGILGVAFIQAILAGIGMMVAGVPGAGLWALVCLILAIVQLGVGLVLIPAIIYVFANAGTGTAVAFLVWSIGVIVLDNILKPILLGRGVAVPMWVIFLGAIGGFLSMGIIGLFVGSIVLVLGYSLFIVWLRDDFGAGNPRTAAPGSPAG